MKFIFTLLLLGSLVLNYLQVAQYLQQEESIKALAQQVIEVKENNKAVIACEDSMRGAYAEADMLTAAFHDMEKQYFQCKVRLTIMMENASEVTTHPIP